MSATSQTNRQVKVLLASLVVSVVVTVLPNWQALSFTRADEIMLGVTLFVAFLIIDLVWVLGRIEEERHSQYTMWRLRQPAETILSNIRTDFAAITAESYGEKDLFVAHFTKELVELEGKIREVAENKSLRVQADHFLSVDNVLDAFHGQTEAVWRYTWVLNRNEQLFDDLSWRRYFESTVNMVASGHIKQIKSLFIVEDFSILEEERIARLLHFIKTHPGLECRLMLRTDYERICADDRDVMAYEDFGIYGNRLLFLTEQYEPVIVGIFVKEPARIAKYLELFETMWAAKSITRSNPSTCDGLVSLEELFEYDLASGPRRTA